MQTSLFDQHNIYKSAFHQNLQEFDLSAAQISLRKWSNMMDAPGNLVAKMETIQHIHTKMNNAGSSKLILLAQIYSTCDSNPDYAVLKSELKSFRQGLLLGISKNLPPALFDFIIPDLHPAEIYIGTGHYNKAVTCIDTYIGKFGENALLRQLQGFAFHRMGVENSAKIAFCYALFDNPLACKTEYLYPADYENRLHYLAEKTGNLKTAWLRLPFALWREGKTIVTPEATGFEDHLKGQIKSAGTNIRLNPDVNLIHFNHLLYLAEMIRLRHERGARLPEMENIREQMRAVNPDLFQLYYTTLNSFRNY